MSEEKELEMQAEEATIEETSEEITEEAVEAADDYGIFSFLADLPIFAIEKQIYTAPPKKKEPVKKVQVVDCTIPDVAPRDTGAVYDWIYYFGLQIIRRVRHAGRLVKRILRKPVHAVAVFASILFLLLDRIALDSVRNATNDIRKLRAEIRILFATKNKQKRKGLFKRHPNAVRTLGNLAAPIAAFAVLLVTVGYWTSSTYALEVVVDNNGEPCSLGYISDESVFIQARSIVKERIDSGAADEDKALIANPTYKITRVKLNELSDAHAISDRLIENSDSKLTNACGVYIDGEFICSVKNETDARSVFNNLLSEAEEKYNINAEDPNSFADFVEDVEFVQGLYSDDADKMWEASRLLDVLTNQKKSEALYYTIQNGDTPSGVASEYDISYSELRALNPNVNFGVFKVGTKLLVSQEVNFVRVKIIKIVERNESTPFKTEKIESSKLFRGDTRTIRKGVKGTD
ncbi:MAG: LysM peptidoglycan-binding domain-containing protein [Clostridia bacterium]|nr:LysM peptidoglycan-binding domain-containing protein [Clostridia bacterium]